jgi:hypothetical protein
MVKVGGKTGEKVDFWTGQRIFGQNCRSKLNFKSRFEKPLLRR